MNKTKQNFFSILTSYFSFERGFTLIELLIVMGVVGILASVLIIAINPLTQLQKSRDSQRKSDLEQVQRALEVYYNDTGSYPAAATVTFGSAWGTYMAKVPQDPVAGRNYAYKVAAGNQSYWLYASLERSTTDPQRCSVSPCANSSGVSCGAGGCTYGVSSPNTTP